MNQMRELFEKWAKSECLDTDSVDGFYSDNDTHIAWGSWQAAQSAAVPVVGDVVAWDNFPGYLLDHQEGSMVTEENLQFWLSAFIKNTDYNKPATSISAAELDALRKDAGIAVAGRNIAFNALQEIIDLDYQDNLADAKLVAVKAMTQSAAIDAAIAGER